MKFKIVERLCDHRRPESITAKLRARRQSLFLSLLRGVPRPMRLLDVGGTDEFWQRTDLGPDVEVVILNYDPGAPHRKYHFVVGDARDMHQFRDKEFDVAFSNSVIEHVGGLKDQRRMANEMRRVGRRVFVQAPHRYFPIEPHFLYPFFQSCLYH